MPDPLAEALVGDAAAAWEALSPSRRREILSYLGFLRTETALERKVIAELTH
jgi:uncharacterized protein YdeI (YjbR/CyaY-like superfamily)